MQLVWLSADHAAFLEVDLGPFWKRDLSPASREGICSQMADELD